jgi:glutamine synthetase type III
LPDISFLRKNVRGIKGVFLTKEGEVLDVDVELNKDVKYLSKSISYLIEVICDKKGDVRKLSIVGNDRFFIFFHNSYVLGIVASPDVNVPLLNVVAGRMLEHVEVPSSQMEKIVKEAKDEVLERLDAFLG